MYVPVFIHAHLYIQHMSYYVLIAQFMPRVEIVQKQTSTVRRLYIQGHNGKVSTFGGTFKQSYYGKKIEYL